MAIAKTKLVNITADLQDLDKVLERFVGLRCIHPVLATEFVEKVHGLTAFSADNPCSVILKELTDMEKEFEYTIEVATIDYIGSSTEEMKSYVANTHQKIKAIADQKKNTHDLIQKYQNALIQIKNIGSLDISLDDVFSCDYVYSRVGRLPNDSVEKLKYYRSRPFIFKSFSEDKNYSWCMYFTSNEYEREVDNIFSSLFFERIHIPDFVHGTPEAAEVTLQNEITFLEDSLKQIDADMKKILSECDHDLGVVKAQLLFQNRTYEAKKYVVGLGDKFTITGFIEPIDEPTLRKQFEGINDLEIRIRPALSDMRLKAPTKLKNNWFSRPFSMFVEMYGLPSYTDIDPTPFVALTYSLLFGIMFGDLGQGLLLCLIGFLFVKWKKMKLAEIGIRIGLSSAFFGLLYGSFFGNETILTPFYTNVLGLANKPIEVMDVNFTMTLLIFAILLGASLILMSICLNIYSHIKKKKVKSIIFSHNGIAGLTFYLFVFGGLILKLKFGVNIFTTIPVLIFIALPLILIFLKEPLDRKMHSEKMFPSGIGGFITEGFFELFEILLSYITNTMSFLRVGGFVLAHAGLMLVVFSLMSMTSASWASTLIFILGNLLVMVLEAMIVGIQVLRLEFYEMFSRFYEGNGVPFKTFNPIQ